MPVIVRLSLLLFCFITYPVQAATLYFDFPTLSEIDKNTDRTKAKSDLMNYLLTAPFQCENNCYVFDVASSDGIPELGKDLYQDVLAAMSAHAENDDFISKSLFVLSTIQECASWGGLDNTRILAKLFILQVNKKLESGDKDINWSYRKEGLDQFKLLQYIISSYEKTCHEKIPLTRAFAG